MEQQHFQDDFRVRFSVSTKLLLIITVLLTVPIFFLNISAISLFRADKKAYVYDSQATLAVVAGREFTNYLNHAMETLKLVLGSADFTKPLSQENKNYIQFFLDNQSTLIGTDLYTVNSKFEEPKLAYRNFQSAALQELKIEKPDLLRIDTEVLSQHSKSLFEKGYHFVNISKNGIPPLLAVLFANTTQVDANGKVLERGRENYQVAVGYVNLKYFISGSLQSFNRMIIANREGRLLFDSEITNLFNNTRLTGDGAFEEAWSTAATSGAKEYHAPNGVRFLGSYYKPGFDLVVLSLVDFEKAMRATYTLTEKFVQLGLAALGFMIILGLAFSKTISTPLKRLFNATAQVSSGNFNINIPIRSRDEFGALTNSFLAMSRKISDLIQEMVDKVRVDQELAIAKTVQQSLFPPPLIQNEHLLLASHYQSASECGGDWWGYFKVGNKHTMVIADATGHGLPSALMTASIRSCFSVIERLSQDERFIFDPGEMLKVANRVVYDAAQGKIMMTCFACILDFDSREITYASAAHNPPWHYSEGKLGSLIATGQRLGESQDLVREYEVKTAPLLAGDTLILYTDGLLEGKNPAGEQYGKKKARQVCESNIGQDPATIIRTLMSDFMIHNNGKALDDDVTLAMARILV